MFDKESNLARCGIRDMFDKESNLVRCGTRNMFGFVDDIPSQGGQPTFDINR